MSCGSSDYSSNLDHISQQQSEQQEDEVEESVMVGLVHGDAVSLGNTHGKGGRIWRSSTDEWEMGIQEHGRPRVQVHA